MKRTNLASVLWGYAPSVLVYILLVFPYTALGTGNENVTVPLPDSNLSTFRTNSRAMWQNETAAVLGRYFPTDWVYSGGTHGVSGTCTSSAFSVEAFTSPTSVDARSERVRAKSDGTGGSVAINYSLVGANCSNPGSDTARVAACSLSGNSTGNWQRATGSNYFVNAVDTVPSIPPGCAALMDVVITNGAISLVGNIARHAPIASPPDVVTGMGKNVRECGALVDGITDDTAAINSCLATFSHVFVPAGVLKHSGTIHMNIMNKLSGVAPGEADGNAYTASGLPVLPGSTLRYTGTGDAIDFINPALQPIGGYIIIEDLMLRSATAARGIHVKNVVGVWINRVIIDGRATPLTVQSGFTVSGIDIDMTINGTDATFDIRITDCHILYTVGIGIRTGGNNVNIVNIVGNGIQGSGGCIAIQGHGLGVLIHGNEMEGCGQALYIDYAAAVHVVGNYTEMSVGDPTIPWVVRRCTGCTFENNLVFGQGSGVTPEVISVGETAGGATTQGITIRGNYCAKATVCWGIHYAQGLTIEQNVLFDDVTNELGGDFTLVESFDYKRATCDPTGSGTTCTNDEARPVTLGQNTTVTPVLNTTTETTVYTYSLKGHTTKNQQNQGGVRVFLQGVVTNVSAGTVDMTVRTYLGTVVLSALRWQAIAINGAPRAFSLDGVIRPSIGFPGNHECLVHGLLGGGDTVKNTVIDSPSTDRLGACNSAVAGVDLKVDQPLKVTVQFSVADANISFFNINTYLQRIGY